MTVRSIHRSKCGYRRACDSGDVDRLALGSLIDEVRNGAVFIPPSTTKTYMDAWCSVHQCSWANTGPCVVTVYGSLSPEDVNELRGTLPTYIELNVVRGAAIKSQKDEISSTCPVSDPTASETPPSS